jgi:hypothetical protein
VIVCSLVNSLTFRASFVPVLVCKFLLLLIACLFVFLHNFLNVYRFVANPSSLALYSLASWQTVRQETLKTVKYTLWKGIPQREAPN